MPLEITSMDGEVAPVDQRYDEPALAVRVTDWPWQNETEPPAVIDASGSAFTVTGVAADIALQPFASVTVTL